MAMQFSQSRYTEGTGACGSYREFVDSYYKNKRNPEPLIGIAVVSEKRSTICTITGTIFCFLQVGIIFLLVKRYGIA